MKKISKKTIQALKIFFIPCEGNNYEPKSLDGRLLFVVVMCLALLKFLILPVFSFFGQSFFYASVNKDALIALVNEERVKNSLAPLKENQVLDKTAELKAQNMLDLGYFSHNSPTGTTPWYWFKQAGYDYKTAGENLAIGFIESSEVFNAWKESPSHKANLLNPKFEEVGIAVIKGIFQGQETAIVVQSFGTQRVKSVQKVEQTPTPAPTKESTPTPTKTAQTPTPTPPQKQVVVSTPTPVSTPNSVSSLTPFSSPSSTPTPKVVAQSETKEMATPKITSGPAPTPNENIEGTVAGEVKDISSPKLFSIDEEMKAIEGNIIFTFWKFMVTNYYDLIQRIVFYVLIFIVVALLLNIFVKIGVQRPALIFKAVFFIALLVGFSFLDKESILRIIPHDLNIF